MYNDHYFWLCLICFVITVLKSITSIFLLFTRLILISCTFTQKEHSALDFCLFFEMSKCRQSLWMLQARERLLPGFCPSSAYSVLVPCLSSQPQSKMLMNHPHLMAGTLLDLLQCLIPFFYLSFTL